MDKYNFLKKETEVLGHILTKDGVKPNPNKIKVIKELELKNKKTNKERFGYNMLL